MNTSDKRKIQVLTAFLLIFAFSLPFLSYAGFPLELTYPSLPKPGGGTIGITSNTSLPDLLVYAFTFFVVTGGLIAFGSIVYAGFLFMISGANPALRSKAMSRIKNTLFGLALLFGSYIIFNTINPELVQVYTQSQAPGSRARPAPPSVSLALDSVDYDTLRYGGVVVFENASTSGASGKSETILHHVGDETFKKASFIASTSTISAIKIVGNCEVAVSAGALALSLKPSNLPGYAGRFILQAGLQGSVDGGSGFDNKVGKLTFADKNCIGHSVKVFERENYNAGAPPQVRGGGQNGSLLLLMNEADFAPKRFVGDTITQVANSVSSVRFALDNTPQDISLVENEPLRLDLCENKGYGGRCIQASTTIPAISAQPFVFDNKTKSARFSTVKYRQAGVILYENTDFEKRQEVFIASDRNLDGNFIGKNNISSLKIIGQYRVTLYENPNFAAATTWIQFDNTDPQSPQMTRRARVIGTQPPQSLMEKGGFTGGILAIPDLRNFCIEHVQDNNPESDCKSTFNDKIHSIEIQVPVRVFDDKFRPLLPQAQGYCVLDEDGDDNFCRL